MQRVKNEAKRLLVETLFAAGYCGAIFALVVLIVR